MSDKLEIKDIFSKVATKYDLINNVISFSIHKYWEKKLILSIKKYLLERNNNLFYENSLDLCTGTGALLRSLSKFSKNLYALDISPQMLEIAKKRKNLKNLNISFIEGEAENLPFNDDFFDLIVVSYGVRNFYDLNKGLQEIKRTLKHDGILYILEFGKIKCDSAIALLWSKVFVFYFTIIMPFIVKFFLGNKKAYKYLSTSALNFPSGSDFVKILSQNGLMCEEYKKLFGQIAYIYKCKINNCR